MRRKRFSQQSGGHERSLLDEQREPDSAGLPRSGAVSTRAHSPRHPTRRFAANQARQLGQERSNDLRELVVPTRWSVAEECMRRGLERDAYETRSFLPSCTDRRFDQDGIQGCARRDRHNGGTKPRDRATRDRADVARHVDASPMQLEAGEAPRHQTESVEDDATREAPG